MEWIKLKDKKPKKYQECLIAIDWRLDKSVLNYEICSWDGRHFTYWDGYNDCESYYNNRNVYAWMEIPECKI